MGQGGVCQLQALVEGGVQLGRSVVRIGAAGTTARFAASAPGTLTKAMPCHAVPQHFSDWMVVDCKFGQQVRGCKRHMGRAAGGVWVQSERDMTEALRGGRRRVYN